MYSRYEVKARRRLDYYQDLKTASVAISRRNEICVLSPLVRPGLFFAKERWLPKQTRYDMLSCSGRSDQSQPRVKTMQLAQFGRGVLPQVPVTREIRSRKSSLSNKSVNVKVSRAPETLQEGL